MTRILLSASTKLLCALHAYKKDDGGAVTVDWVVLGSILVALAIGIMSTLSAAITDFIAVVADFISSQGDEIESFDTFDGS